MGSIYQDGRTGNWLLLRMHLDDIAAIDAEAQVPPPVPSDTVQLGPKYTCAPPDESEPLIR